MNIALLNEKITIQKNVVEVDKIGNHRNVWTDYFSCHATISGERGKETHVIGTTVENVDIAFTIRWCNKLSNLDSTNYRIVFHDEYFNIISIDHMSYKKECIKLRCQRVRRTNDQG